MIIITVGQDIQRTNDGEPQTSLVNPVISVNK